MITPRILVAVATCSLFASPVLADLSRACFPDYMRFCSTVVPGEGRVAKCLNTNRASLSRACGEALAAVLSCRPEIERYCSHVSEPGQIKICLKRKSAQLGETCLQNLSRF